MKLIEKVNRSADRLAYDYILFDIVGTSYSCEFV